MKYSKIIIPTILVSSSFLVFYGLKNQFSNQTNNTNSLSKNSSSVNQQDQINSNVVYQKLSILSNRCRGCGKCVRIDREHFEMSSRLATVISSTNLNSSNLTLAINNCPTRAIVLE